MIRKIGNLDGYQKEDFGLKTKIRLITLQKCMKMFQIADNLETF